MNLISSSRNGAPNSRLFDTHAHLGDPLLYEMGGTLQLEERALLKCACRVNRDQARCSCEDGDQGDDRGKRSCGNFLDRAAQGGVSDIVSICTDAETLERSRQLTQCHPKVNVYLAAATGPNEVESEAKIFWECVEDAARGGELIAVGETGLDLYWNRSSLHAQMNYFIQCIELSCASKLPLILHCREAFTPLFAALDQYFYTKASPPPVLLHCFSGGLRELEMAQERGIYLGFGGLITYRSAQEVQQAAALVASELFVLETDTPYLPPGPKRPRVNEPYYLGRIASAMAKIRGVSYEEIAQASCHNAERLFNINTSK